MTKSELRKIYLEKQKSLSGFERNEQSRRIAAGFFECCGLENIRRLHVFLAIEVNGEVETSFIYQRLWSDFPAITTVAPRVDLQTMTLASVRFTSQTKLAANKWRIFEPTENDLVEVEKIDAVLVPLLCFDQRGFRVGYGGGFYDKFLKDCRSDCLKIGLSYYAPVKEISDAQAFDAKLDLCITPQRVYSWQKQ